MEFPTFNAALLKSKNHISRINEIEPYWDILRKINSQSLNINIAKIGKLLGDIEQFA